MGHDVIAIDGFVSHGGFGWYSGSALFLLLIFINIFRVITQSPDPVLTAVTPRQVRGDRNTLRLCGNKYIPPHTFNLIICYPSASAPLHSTQHAQISENHLVWKSS
jgi:hypothetical protein